MRQFPSHLKIIPIQSNHPKSRTSVALLLLHPDTSILPLLSLTSSGLKDRPLPAFECSALSLLPLQGDSSREESHSLEKLESRT